MTTTQQSGPTLQIERSSRLVSGSTALLQEGGVYNVVQINSIHMDKAFKEGPTVTDVVRLLCGILCFMGPG